MKKYQAYLSLLAFSFMMGIKCFQPALTESIRTRVFEAMDRNCRVQQTLETLGREYAENGLRGELIEVFCINGWFKNTEKQTEDSSTDTSTPSTPTPSPAVGSVQLGSDT